MKNLIKCLFYCSIIFSPFLAGCSFFGRNGPTAEAKATVLGVASDYLSYIVQGSEKRLNSIVLWEDLLGHGTDHPMTKDEYRAQMQLLRTRWSPQDSPLLGLEVLDLQLKGDNATVILRKAGRQDYPKIWIELYWTGAGWLVIDDSLFGKGKLALTSAEAK